VDHISPGQVNALVSIDTPTGLQHLVVTTGVGASSAYDVTVNPIEPGLLAPASFNINGVQYVFASFADGTYVLPAGAISGVNSRTAKPGDLLTLYGVGFGPVTPAAGDGQIEQQLNTLASSFAIKLGGAPVTASYDGLAPQAVGLYQFNITHGSRRCIRQCGAHFFGGRGERNADALRPDQRLS